MNFENICYSGSVKFRNRKIETVVSRFAEIAKLLLKGEHYEKLIMDTIPMLTAVYAGHLRQQNEVVTPSKPEVQFYCAVCNERVRLSEQETQKIVDGELQTPMHHDKQTLMRIIRQSKDKRTSSQDYKREAKARIYSLLEFQPSLMELGKETKLLSVGIDVGTSTMHLIFSHLIMRKDKGFFNMTNRMNFGDRKIIYQSDIIDTPLLDDSTIDIEKVVEFCKDKFRKTGIVPEMVETGVVIVTGEGAKRRNAAEIVERLASETGKFVSATAGSNFESVLGALGSGMVDRSVEKRNNSFMLISEEELATWHSSATDRLSKLRVSM